MSYNYTKKTPTLCIIARPTWNTAEQEKKKMIVGSIVVSIPKNGRRHYFRSYKVFSVYADKKNGMLLDMQSAEKSTCVETHVLGAETGTNYRRQIS